MSVTALPRPAGVAAALPLLDEALVALGAVDDAAVALADVEAPLAVALREVYRALGSLGQGETYTAAATAAADATRAALTAAQGAASDDPAARRATALVARALWVLTEPPGAEDAEDATARADVPRAGAPAKLVPATVGEPRLLDPPRDVLLPSVPLPPREVLAAVPVEPATLPAPSRVRSAAELDDLLAGARAKLLAMERDAEAPAAPADLVRDTLVDAAPQPASGARPTAAALDARAAREHFGEQLSEDDLLFDRARGCVEELAALGQMRRPLGEEPWYCPRTEERLLARVDALVACGAAVLPRLVRLLEERPVPDPELTWAHVFLFGCLAGDDALDQALRVARAAPLDDPAVEDAVADALAHAPHPGVVRAMQSWLGHDAPSHRAVAVAVLGRRAAITAAEAARAAGDGDVRVVRAAARALGTTTEPAGPGALVPLLRHDDEAVVRNALESAALLRVGAGARRACELVTEGRGAWADAARIAAVAGEPDAAGEALLAAARAGASPAVLEALGWWGGARAVEPLLAALRADGDATPGAAALALQRITAAGLDDEAAAPVYAEGDEPFRGGWRAPEPVAELTAEADAWARWWTAHGPRTDAKARYRWGRAWSAAAALWELEDEGATPDARRLCRLELVARTGEGRSFDPERFIARQRADLAALRRTLGC